MSLSVERQPEILRGDLPPREPPALTRTEGALFKFLSFNEGRLCTWDEISQEVWGIPPGTALRSVLFSLRGKLAEEGLEIFSHATIGLLLGQRTAPDLPFFYQPGPEGQSELLKKVNLLWAPPGKTRLRTPYLELHESQRLAIELLNFILRKENLGRCLSFQEVWQAVYRSDFYYQEENNRNSLSNQLWAARKVLKGAAPDENWHLATIRRHDKLIMLQGKAGDEVKLPGLYPKAKAELTPIMERGVLKPDSTISPSFSATKAAILLKLAKSPGYISEEGLLGLCGDEPRTGNSLKNHISYLRKRLKKAAVNIEIKNKYGLGYALVFETP